MGRASDAQKAERLNRARMLLDKLAQAYQLLVPDRRRALGAASLEPSQPVAELNHEQACGDLCSSILGSSEGESHNCQPDHGLNRVRSGKRVHRTAGMG